MSKPVLPNFFIVGAPKAGSTSLYSYLDQHPQIYMSPIKEPCFLAPEIKPENFSEESTRPFHLTSPRNICNRRWLGSRRSADSSRAIDLVTLSAKWCPMHCAHFCGPSTTSNSCSLILEPADRKSLIEFYRKDICQLQQLLGRDLSVWMR